MTKTTYIASVRDGFENSTVEAKARPLQGHIVLSSEISNRILYQATFAKLM